MNRISEHSTVAEWQSGDRMIEKRQILRPISMQIWQCPYCGRLYEKKSDAEDCARSCSRPPKVYKGYRKRGVELGDVDEWERESV